ncbi:N-acetyltransferase [Deinococcus cellulosilyticus NBRC 106333 = KACC 11606]|uniref:N-acetyltransferase n=2 Tax=Deinococcus cellulosilyticus TaxID=401558 RepID=A0A511N4V6_DEIC1|nr:N-acetyltransferase [Deinococcus cellulosilyticus NBRC 106333 = KACC 11606]
MPMQIRPFQPEDTQGIVQLILPIQTEEFGIPITLEDQPDLLDIQNFYQQGQGNFWVAVQDGQVVGTISLLDIGNNQGALRKMFVHPDFRGKPFGTAQKLLEVLLSWAREKGMKEVLLGTTAKYLAAHRFYEKNGFVQMEAEDLPANFPRMQVDTRFYRISPDQYIL